MSYHYQKNEPGGYEDAYDMVSFWVHSCCRGIVEREARKGKEALEGVDCCGSREIFASLMSRYYLLKG
jgi:hypothetical protein